MKVGITGINGTDNPGPGFAIARSLKEADPTCEIIGLSYDINDPGNYMDFIIDKSSTLPYPSKGAQIYFDKLYEIKKQFGLDYIIPNLDAELPLYIKYQQELKDKGIDSFLPSKETFELRDKERLLKVAQKLGIKYPKSACVANEAALQETIQKDFEFPLVIKGRYYKAYVVRTMADALRRYYEIVAEWGTPIIVQEFVTGDEFNVVGIGDGHGKSLGMVGIKKLTTTSIGKIVNGVTIKNEPMINTASQIVEQFKWRGPFELECIVNQNDVYLIEINPRFPAWTWFATAVGVNLPERLIKYLQGERVEYKLDYPTGKLFVRYTYELVTDIEKYSQLAMQKEI
ncbi:MAG: ATP-grasp domain-containing protein [Bacteriovoracaceae bacterium]|nr:ATP-grasp domain-containing protein [Bacteriovoracaceae bacterium]